MRDYFKNRQVLGSIPQMPVVVPSFFKPTDLSGCIVWLDASQITGKSDSDLISQWNDLSGNNNHATQGNSSYQPAYKVNLINGKPAVRSTGSQWLTLPSINIRTVIIVCVHEQYTGLNGIFCQAGSDSENIRLENASNYFSGNSGDFIYNGSFFVNNVSTYGISLNVPHCAYAVRASNRTFSPDILRGAYDSTRHMRGFIAEVIVYNTTLSETDRGKVFTYLKNKYNL